MTTRVLTPEQSNIISQMKFRFESKIHDWSTKTVSTWKHYKGGVYERADSTLRIEGNDYYVYWPVVDRYAPSSNEAWLRLVSEWEEDVLVYPSSAPRPRFVEIKVERPSAVIGEWAPSESTEKTVVFKAEDAQVNTGGAGRLVATLEQVLLGKLKAEGEEDCNHTARWYAGAVTFDARGFHLEFDAGCGVLLRDAGEHLGNSDILNAVKVVVGELHRRVQTARETKADRVLKELVAKVSDW